MKRKINSKARLALGGVLMIYCLLYAYYRTTLNIIHTTGFDEMEDVRAHGDPWSSLSRDMTRSNALMRAIVTVREPAPEILNGLFWPLRQAELLMWKTIPGN